MFLIVFCTYGGADQVQAKKGHQQPAAPVAVVSQQQPDRPSPRSEDQKDIHAQVEIINPPQKDFYDKVLVWINALLVLVAAGTGIVIYWQAVETRNAANGAKEAAVAALQQVELTREKERARLYVEPGTLTSLHDQGGTDWALRVRLEVENAGNSRAYGIGGEVEGRGCMWIQGISDPTVPPPLELPWSGNVKYISEGAITVSLDSQFIPVTPATIEKALYGDQAIFLQGFVRYETLGKRFCKRFGYRWWTGSFDRTGLNFGDRFIEGRWLEDDQQDNSESEIPPKPN